MTASSLSLRALNRATLARQVLLAREAESPLAPLAVTERLVGLQAQWPRPPFLGLWSRIEGFRREDLHRLLHDRAVVRATFLRGTLHLVAAQDYLILRAALQPLLTRGMHAILRQRAVILDEADLAAAARVRLQEEPRTFEDLRDYLVSRDPEGDERAMGYAVRMTLPLVMVPTDDPWGFPTVSRFALAESWLGAPLHPDDGPAALVLRYLAAFGPASVADAQNWSGFQKLREVFEALRPRLLTFRDERKRELFDLPEAPRPPEDTPAPVRFLPEFDNLVLGHDDRKRFVADEHRSSVYLPGLRVAPTFLVDGFVAGTWKLERKKGTATLAVEPFGKLSKSVQADLTDEAGRLVRFAEPDAKSHDVRIG
ncbi:MAG TPA: winged helix DNA-binding domain-containing protein [Thermoanaerobaculia bacterium]|nr:winged helix DNA-binding domain-containing protein [Thermoanaerobaculia bacterium]